MKLNKSILLLLCLAYFLFHSGLDQDRENFLKPSTNDHYNNIAINEVLMYVSNNGDGSHDPHTDGSGFYWPGGKNAHKAAVFEDGLLWGGIVDSQIRVNGNTHFQGLQAGKILSPDIADNPALPKYRVYKIKKNWQNHPQDEEHLQYERDYNEWPVEDGAPWVDVDDDGIFTRGVDKPKYIGDETLWYVSNDLDMYRSKGTYGSEPIGLEFQTTVWGYNEKNVLADVVFKKYLVINKSRSVIDSMYFSYWTDDDLGDAADDFVGCDTLLNLGYSYNGDNEDGDGAGIQYGLNPPAVGHMFLQGPMVPSEPFDKAKFKDQWLLGYKNLSVSSFVLYIGANTVYKDPSGRVYEGTLEVYNYMQGMVWNGNPFIDPHTNLPTKFCVPGDPVDGEGWYEGDGWPEGEDPNDRRFLLTCGPLTMAPGDTQEVVIAILMGQGEDHLDSITELKKTSKSVQAAYDNDFNTTPVMDKPSLKSAHQDKSVMLYWDMNAEDFDVVDPVLAVHDIDDKSYTFEGYRLWQYKDLEGTDPRLLATYDIKPSYDSSENNVTIIYDWILVNGFYSYVPVIVGNNSGIHRSHHITVSIYDDQPLSNGNPYYFAVTAYAYSEYSFPVVIESEPQIIEVIPGLKGIDQTSIHETGDRLIADHISGKGDGYVELFVVDPVALTGDEYRVIFDGEERSNPYTFINYTTNDTIIADCTDYVIDSVGALVTDGFILKIHNDFIEQSWTIPRDYFYIKNVLEMKGPGGMNPGIPVDIFENINSTGDWEISSYGNYPSLMENLDMSDWVGSRDYEIRFTSSGSDYYLTGGFPGFKPWRSDDPKATDKVPFEIWDLGQDDSDEDDLRLTIKILDNYHSLIEDSTRVDQNGTWSQLVNGDWEPIFAYLVDSTYQEPLPESSGRLGDFEYPRPSVFRVGRIIIRGNLPEEGTVIRINTWKPMTSEDVFSVIATAPNTKDYESAKISLDDISVFPNPFFGTALYSGYAEQSFVRFTNLPAQVTLRIFSIGGTYVRRIDKNDQNPWLDWDLNNNAGESVASGVYIAHLEMPNIGEKVMKVAVILENRP